MIQDFLRYLGMHEKEIEIYLALTKFGHSSASYIAHQTGRERTSSYKLMISMHHKGYLTMTGKGNSRLFAVIEIDTLKKQFVDHIQKLKDIENNFESISIEFQQLKTPLDYRPNIELLEGVLGIQKAYENIINYLHTKDYIHCYCIASKTFESLANTNPKLQSYNSTFIEQLKKLSIHIHGLYAHGMSLMESLTQSSLYQDALDLPTTNNAIQVRITGDLVTTFIMKKNPQIIQITSHELAMLWMFLGEQLGK